MPSSHIHLQFAGSRLGKGGRSLSQVPVYQSEWVELAPPGLVWLVSEQLTCTAPWVQTWSPGIGQLGCAKTDEWGPPPE